MAKERKIASRCSVYRFSAFGEKAEHLGFFDVEMTNKDVGFEADVFQKIREGVRSIAGTEEGFRPKGLWVNGIVKSSFRKGQTTMVYHAAPSGLFDEDRAVTSYRMFSTQLGSAPDNDVESGIGVELYPKGYILYVGKSASGLFGRSILAVNGVRAGDGIRWGSGDWLVKPIDWWLKKLKEKEDVLCFARKEKNLFYTLLPSHELYDERDGLSPRKLEKLLANEKEIFDILGDVNAYDPSAGDESGNVDIPISAYPDEVKEEAVRRMRALDISEATIRRFLNGRLVMGGVEGLPNVIDEHMRETVDAALGYKLYPYYTMSSKYHFGNDPKAYRIDTVLYVSAEKDAWNDERCNDGYMDVFCSTVNEGCTEFGAVKVKPVNGGIIRIPC